MGLIIHLKAHGNRPLYLLRAIRRRQPRLPRALRDCRAQGFMLDYFRLRQWTRVRAAAEPLLTVRSRQARSWYRRLEWGSGFGQ